MTNNSQTGTINKRFSIEEQEPTIITAMRDIVDVYDAGGGAIEEVIQHLYSIATPDEQYPLYEIAKLCRVRLPHILEA